MLAPILKQTISGEKLKNVVNIPDYLLNYDLEVIIKPKKKKSFKSFEKIKLNTRNFKFNREEANAR